MSELFEVIRTRRSIRKYKGEVPAKSKIEKVIEEQIGHLLMGTVNPGNFML
ncbi:hypothetical protein C8C78_12246 [Halanaerobium congolense]|uniref:Nitroreductase family protein n=1 Tax=Halanaerobium congolense TaxID=54121 RepID=A0A318E4S0_9FIRM|nr:hypothetical protein [Halanaerobium congolense]PXV63688.1 hypothetical protein C8C78_12246 [Halanaerobium congolense]